jgi:succinyl-CoA synthetase alpha subunit
MLKGSIEMVSAISMLTRELSHSADANGQGITIVVESW